jgi:[acyl-carrier-protein] S-malonyltransferase
MKQAYIFPGQGAQFTGMGQQLFDTNTQANELFLQAAEILGFPIHEIMFTGSAEELKQTNVTQPAVFLHSVIQFLCLANTQPTMVAGHSLGEFSALVANNCLSFADALLLVSKRANAMQKACEQNPSTMAAILGLEDGLVEEICASITNEIVVPANYNCPGQLVISGSHQGIELACEKMKEAGAKRALVLPVGGAFHSPLMQPAKAELQSAIEATIFNNAKCPVYQNVNAMPFTDAKLIQQNLIDQLTGPVRWTQCVQAMIADGASSFIEVGPGNVLQGLVKKINKDAIAEGVS